MTEIIRLWIQAAEMNFLSRVAGLSLRNRVRSLDILRKLRAPAHSDRKEPAELVQAQELGDDSQGRP